RARISSCWPRAGSMRACGRVSARQTRLANVSPMCLTSRSWNHGPPIVLKKKRVRAIDRARGPMDDRHSILDSITGAFVPIHPDGHKFVFGAAGVTLLLFLLTGPLGWLGVIATAYCAYFFRDPPRVTPKRA